MNKQDNLKNIFYDYQKVLSYNALLYILIGERGVGKTYGFKKFVIKRFLKTGKQFVYIRRYESDLEESVGTNTDQKFFEQIKEEFPNHTFKISKSKKVRRLYIDDKICGYALPLSSADSLKSSTYEKVDVIGYDEFMLKEGSSQHYLKNEPEIILDIIETIARLRDIRVFCLGNAISSTCPLMSYFDLTLPYNSDIKTFKDGLIVVNYIKNQAYREVKHKSKFGKLIEGTRYAKYAIDNEFLTDSKAFIKKKYKTSKFYFIIKLNHQNYGVWRDSKTNSLFISQDLDPNCPIRFVLNNENHDENSILTKCRTNPYFKNVFNHYKLGLLYFESQKVKNIFNSEVLKFLY